MSRTYRRKNSHYEWWSTSDTGRRADGTWKRVPGTKCDIARYHSDTNRHVWPGMGSCGKYGKKSFVREMRFKNKEILDRAVREYNDEPMFIPYVHPYR